MESENYLEMSKLSKVLSNPQIINLSCHQSVNHRLNQCCHVQNMVDGYSTQKILIMYKKTVYLLFLKKEQLFERIHRF